MCSKNWLCTHLEFIPPSYFQIILWNLQMTLLPLYQCQWLTYHSTLENSSRISITKPWWKSYHLCFERILITFVNIEALYQTFVILELNTYWFAFLFINFIINITSISHTYTTKYHHINPIFSSQLHFLYQPAPFPSPNSLSFSLLGDPLNLVSDANMCVQIWSHLLQYGNIPVVTMKKNNSLLSQQLSDVNTPH